MTKTDKGPGRKKHRRCTLFSSIIIFLALVALSLNLILESAVKNELSKYIRTDQDRVYDIALEDIRINIWKGNFLARGIYINPRSDSLFHNNVTSFFTIKLDTFLIKGLNIRDLLLKKKLNMDRVELIAAKSKFYQDTTVAYREKKKNSVPLKDILSREFRSASVEQFNFRNASFAYYNLHDTIQEFFADSISLRITSLFIDTATMNKRIPIAYREMDFGFKHLEFTSMKYYSIGIGSFKILSGENTLNINDFRLIPKYSKEQFSQRIPYETDWYDLNTSHIQLIGFDRDMFENNNTLSVDTLTILQPEVMIFRDKHVKDPPFKYKKLLGSLIMDLPVKIHFPYVTLSEGYLTYQEISETGRLPGEVSLSELSVRADNLTNVPAFLGRDSILSVTLNASLNSEGALHLGMDIIIPDKNNRFSVTGSLGSMPLASFNSFIENNLFISVESGDIKMMTYEFTCNDDRSNGIMDFEYCDLKGNLIDQKKEKDKKLVSALANTIVRNNNVRGSRKYKQSSIQVERRKDRGIVNFLVRSITHGMTSAAVPILEKKQQKKMKKK